MLVGGDWLFPPWFCCTLLRANKNTPSDLIRLTLTLCTATSHLARKLMAHAKADLWQEWKTVQHTPHMQSALEQQHRAASGEHCRALVVDVGVTLIPVAPGP